MLRYLFQNPVLRVLRRAEKGPFVPVLAGIAAMLLTATMTLPVTTVLLPAVLIARSRWKSVVLQAAFGSAIGATFLVSAFHNWGWDQVHAAFPAMLESPTWSNVIEWVRRWGVLALFAVAALPLPQTPALIFFALSPHSMAQVLIAILAGKLLKYGVLAFATVRFPERFRGVLNHAD